MSYVTMQIAKYGRGPVLSGALDGKAAFLAMVKDTSREPAEPSPLLLDFKKIDVATASYLREAIFELKSYMRARGSNYYPVVANANEAIREELGVIAEARNDALLAVETDRNGVVTNQSMIGRLDPKQAITFKFVTTLKKTDAGSLMEKFGAEENTTSTTAWNNRLSALVARGLIREYSQGRAKFYRPLFEEVD